MKKYILRLDDACERIDVLLWDKIELLLDKYNVKPLVGIIPHCEDPSMDKYPVDIHFWERVHRWIDKGWCIALHGYNHVYSTNNSGINPIHKRSEFAGEPLVVQRDKIKKGFDIMMKNNVHPNVFFAPSHTFDLNTLIALKEETDIRIISDTIAFRSYQKYGFTFVPQQSGVVRKLPFKEITFCYHPNSMKDKDFAVLENFISRNGFSCFPLVKCKRKKGLLDVLLNKVYFLKRKVKNGR